MTTECKEFDEKLLDYLYEELDAKEQAAWTAHLGGCARCRGEVESFGRVRTAVKGVTMVEPPQAVSAKLLYQAAQRAPRGVVVPLFRRVANHPMYAMAASFLIVGGITGLLWNTSLHREAMEAPATSTPPVTATAPTAIAAAQPSGEAAPSVVVEAAGKAPAALPALAAPVASARPAAKEAPAEEDKLAVTAAVGNQASAQREMFAKGKAERSAPQWIARKGAGGDALDVTPNIDVRSRAQAASGGLGEKDLTGDGKRNGAKERSLADEDRGALAGFGGVAATSNAAPPSDGPLGRSSAYAHGSPAPPPPPKSAPAIRPAPSTKADKQAPPSYEAEQQEGRQVLESNMREVRRGELDRQLAQHAGPPASKPMPAPAAAPQQSAAPSVATPTSARDDQQPVEVEQLLQRLDQQATNKSCMGADETWRQLQEHFPERLTQKARFDHARCQRLLGRFREARIELDRLLVEAPSLRGRIEGELKGLGVEEQSRRAAEAPMPSHAEKKSARPAKAKAKGEGAADSQSAF